MCAVKSDTGHAVDEKQEGKDGRPEDKKRN